MTSLNSLYIHVPFCRHLCNYCDFYKQKLTNREKQISDFETLLMAQWKTHQKMLQEHNLTFAPLDTLYFGGGTPSLWGKAGIQFMERFLQNEIQLQKNCEWTIEVDPGTWTKDELRSWERLGVNRISIGTQSFDNQFLSIMDRAHKEDEVKELLEFAAKDNWNFSVDFMLGLPYSKEKQRDIKTELDQILSYHPKHLSLYILSTRNHYPHQEKLPDDEFTQNEYLFVSDYLKEKGFLHYEVSNFAKPGFESRHNQKYWKTESVAAIGPSATGFFHLNQNEAKRYKWKVTTDQVEWEILSPESLKLEEVYLALRTSSGWKIPEDQKAHQVVGTWVERGFADAEEGVVTLNARGWVMMDSLMDDLFKAKIV